jgi:cellulose synthase operon protein YhjQ
MTDRKTLSDRNETPEDVATLYSWANLHGAKYRDFSASRAQTRETARLRVQQAMEEEHRRAGQEAEAQQAAEAEHAAEEARAAEAARQAELAAQQAAREVERSAQQAARQLELAAQQAAEQAAQRAGQQEAAQQRAWQQTRPDRFSAPPVSNPAPQAAPYYPPPPQQTFDYPGYAQPQAHRPAPSPFPGQPQYAPMREESRIPPQNPWAQPAPREPVGRPAWLTSDRPGMASQSFPPPPQQAPEDTLQGSRDRMTSRWFALRGVFDGTPAPPEALPAPVVSRAPAMAVFSLAGGVGKTSLVATLGRALSARGERVLLVDTAAFGLLPFFFGACDQRPGLLRTFNPPGGSSDAPIQMVTIDPEGLGPEAPGQETLCGEISKFARGANRVIVDLATASGATTRRIMRLAPLVLVPVVPDMNSVVSVSSIDAFFEHNGSPAGRSALPYYVLCQFDASLPLHLDVREVLREQLGERLLPFALHRAPAMSEALAEGMTVMDYAPTSALAEDFDTLAGWVKSLSAPASTSYRGVRWSER